MLKIFKFTFVDCLLRFLAFSSKYISNSFSFIEFEFIVLFIFIGLLTNELNAFLKSKISILLLLSYYIN
jgi:hypothetical protein